jgi:hypothetical protein
VESGVLAFGRALRGCPDLATRAGKGKAMRMATSNIPTALENLESDADSLAKAQSLRLANLESLPTSQSGKIL